METMVVRKETAVTLADQYPNAMWSVYGEDVYVTDYDLPAGPRVPLRFGASFADFYRPDYLTPQNTVRHMIEQEAAPFRWSGTTCKIRGHITYEFLNHIYRELVEQVPVKFPTCIESSCEYRVQTHKEKIFGSDLSIILDLRPREYQRLATVTVKCKFMLSKSRFVRKKGDTVSPSREVMFTPLKRGQAKKLASTLKSVEDVVELVNKMAAEENVPVGGSAYKRRVSVLSRHLTSRAKPRPAPAPVPASLSPSPLLLPMSDLPPEPPSLVRQPKVRPRGRHAPGEFSRPQKSKVRRTRGGKTGARVRRCVRCGYEG